MLQPASSPITLYSALLLEPRNCRCFWFGGMQERNTLWELCETPGLLALLPGILNRRPGLDNMEQLILEFRAAASAAAASAAAVAAADVSISPLSETDSVSDAGREDDGGNQQQQQQLAAAAADGSVLPAGAEEEALDKAQAHVAWLLAALASDPRTRYQVGLLWRQTA